MPRPSRTASSPTTATARRGPRFGAASALVFCRRATTDRAADEGTHLFHPRSDSHEGQLLAPAIVRRARADSATTESPNSCSTIDAMLRALMLLVRASERPVPAHREPTMLTASEVASFVFCPE